jgi:hypothetical protein
VFVYFVNDRADHARGDDNKTYLYYRLVARFGRDRTIGFNRDDS